MTGEENFANSYMAVDEIRRNSPPSIPELIAPLDEFNSPKRTIEFRWRPSNDPDDDKVKYRFYMWSTDSTPDVNEAISVSTIQEGQYSYVVNGLRSGKSYSWKVIADDGKGRTSETETRRFRTR